MTKMLKEGDENFKRLTRYFDPPAEHRTEMNSDGSRGVVELEAPYMGFQNRGGFVPDRTPRKRRVLVFRVNGRGTLVRESLDSVPPIEGNELVFTKFAKGFVLPAGNWDIANKKELLSNLDRIVRGK